MNYLAENPTEAYDEITFRNALSDADVDLIYLSSDITLTAGATINPNRTTLIIEGTHEGRRHTLTEANSDLPSRSIEIAAQSSMTLIFQNIDLVGRNYYGIPRVEWSVNNENVSVEYYNITYNGPQLIYNFRGRALIADSQITIEPGYSRAEEVCEVNRLEFDGVVDIQHNTEDDSRVAFWILGNDETAGITVLEDAKVTVNAKYGYLLYNFNPTTLTYVPVRITVQQGASLTVGTNLGISFTADHRVASFSVGEGASFHYTQESGNGTRSSMYMDGAVTVSPGGVFYMQAENNAAPLIQYGTNAARHLVLNNPKSFVLYNKNAAVIAVATSYGVSFEINGGQLNYWSNAKDFPIAGTIDDEPTAKWFKKLHVPLVVRGMITTTSTTLSYENLSEEGDLPDVSILQLQTGRVISLGTLPLEVNPIVDDQTPITGTTTPRARTLVRYYLEEVETKIYGDADEYGAFLTPTATLPMDTAVTVTVNTPFLIESVIMAVVHAGELKIENAPVHISFSSPPILLDPLVLGRRLPETLSITISDTRVYSSAWELIVSVDGPMRTGSGYKMDDAVVLIGESSMTVIGTLPIQIHESEKDVPTTTITWDDNKGILLHITEPICLNEEYSAILTWDLRELAD